MEPRISAGTIRMREYSLCYRGRQVIQSTEKRRESRHV